MSRTIRVTVGATLAALALTSSGTVPAHADTGSLTLTGPTAVSVGTPAVMTASGQVPSTAFFSRYVYVYAIPTSVVTTCPAELTNALQLSSASSAQGGDSVAFIAVDGTFSVPVAYTAKQAGTFLLCGYLSDMAIVDAASQHQVTATSSTATPPPAGTQRPVNTRRPVVKQRRNRLVCTRGAWTGATSYRFAWQANGRRVRATTTSIKVTHKLRGARVRCVVTARNAVGSTRAASRVRKVR